MLSIVTPTLNNLNGLRKTFLSFENIKNNTLKEWIIVDSYSSDKTIDFINNVKNTSKRDFDIFHINIKKSGPYAAMNYGIKFAKKKYIWIINSGDSILEFNINEFNKIISSKKEKDLPVIFGKVYRSYKEKNFVIGNNNFSNNNKFRLNEIHPSIIIPSFLYKKFGLYNDKYYVAADLDLLLRLKSYNVKFIYMDKLKVSFPYGGISSVKFESFKNVIRILIDKKIGFRAVLYLLLRYLYSRLRALK